MATNQTGLDYGHWVTDKEFNPVSHCGFVYLIINNISGKKYIGKKNFNVRGNSCRHWTKYTGSQKELNNDIKMFGKDNFIFRITHICDTSSELDYTEYNEQIYHNVLCATLQNGEREFYNRCIHNVKFNNSGNMHTSSAKEKIRKSATGKNCGKLSTKADKKIYNFRHTDGITFSGTQYEFKQKFSLPHCSVSELIHKRIQSSNGWILVDNNGNSIIVQNDNKGKNCYRYDNNMYTVKNNLTGEIFRGMRSEILHKLLASKSAVDKLINGSSKSLFKWERI